MDALLELQKQMVAHFGPPPNAAWCVECAGNGARLLAIFENSLFRRPSAVAADRFWPSLAGFCRCWAPKPVRMAPAGPWIPFSGLNTPNGLIPASFGQFSAFQTVMSCHVM